MYIYTYRTYVDIQKFNIKYLVMYKVQMHTGAIIWRSWIFFPYRRTNYTLTIACFLNCRLKRRDSHMSVYRLS